MQSLVKSILQFFLMIIAPFFLVSVVFLMVVGWIISIPIQLIVEILALFEKEEKLI